MNSLNVENTEFILGNKVIPLSIRSTRQARRLTIRIAPAKNKVVLTLPKRVSRAAGLKFLHSKADWILQNIELEFSIRYTEDVILPLFGKEYTLKRLHGRGTSHIDDEKMQVIVYCRPEFIARRVKDLIKKRMKDVCTAPLHALADILEVKVNKLLITKAGSRWGSCNMKGVISLNWLLAFAPQKVLHYVMAHEVAHLKEMNHSPRFWKVVELLHPGAQSTRKWLKKEGYRLHRYE